MPSPSGRPDEYILLSDRGPYQPIITQKGESFVTKSVPQEFKENPQLNSQQPPAPEPSSLNHLQPNVFNWPQPTGTNQSDNKGSFENGPPIIKNIEPNETS